MPRRLVATAVSLALLFSISAPIAPVGAVEACDPFLTTPAYDPSVPTATEVLGFDFGEVQMTVADINALLLAFIVLLFSLTVHELAHAWTADRLGDPTARRLGRVSLNPIVHADPIGTILFPLIAAVRAAGKVTGRESADDAMPPKPLNSLFQGVFGLEARLIGRVPMPFGVSLVAVVRRTD